ncbi:phosphoribulokinase [Metasolibacillus meyeri]|uniref:Phosphoribulokinase n=1 Tax=Metasolibacillus meyeri TaxID=1071052 RepID=A0AAW9NKR2_9BACL|nr:phosphoribulokinase [Metasolibacillus meyeri]MEC1177892.1 phosphoribulokinase [Metasolibacillus meyeri]
MEQLLQMVVGWADAQTERTIIAISGHGAAGKTTFAQELITLFEPHTVNYINTDPYIVASDMRKKTMIDYTYQNESHHYKMTACHPAAHHLPSLERDVHMVREGLDFYTIDTHYAPRTLISSNNKLTIIEGMSAAFIDPALFDLKIYFYTDDETEFVRRAGRDVTERGMELQYLQHSHNERRIQYKVFMHPYSRGFDIVVKTSQEKIFIEKGRDLQ